MAASRLLHWLEEQDGPSQAPATPVDRLRELLGLQVALFHPGTRRAGTYGWLEPGENLIFLRQGLSEPVRRFTLAHEIGHALLHRASGIDVDGFPGGLAAPSRDLLMPEAGTGCEGSDLDAPLMALAPGEEILRPGEAYSAKAQRESEANAFAATLLLPPDRLLSSYLARARQQSAFAGRRPGAITRGLARQFGVSEDVVLRSLAALLQTRVWPDEGEEGPLSDHANGAASLALDPSQLQASTIEAPALIVAGPGTGKTSTLVGRIAYLVKDQGVAPDAILALTFSNKAAREMRERLTALLQSPAMAAPAMPTVSTIHAFCGDLVRRYAPLVGLRPDFRLASEAEGYFLLRQVASEMTLSHYQPLAAPGLHFPALLAAISRAKDELAGPERYREVAERMAEKATTLEERLAAERADEVASVYAGYQDLLRARGDADFGDLICLSVQLLQEQPGILADVRLRYQHILVDEFQDINRAMGVLLRILSGEAGSLWAVGDADQAIYRFRGASPANLARFASDYPSAQVHTLRRNYRSTPDILTTAAAVAAAALGGERAPLQAARQAPETPETETEPSLAIDSASVTLATAPSEQSELAGLAARIKERAEAGRSLDEQVVLCRTRRQCQRVAAALSAAGIPIRMATSLLEQDDAKDMLAVLSLLGDLSGSGLLRAGNIPDHAFGEQEARSVLAEARSAHQSPLVTLLQRLDCVELATPSGRAGLATLAQIVSELQQAPDILTAVSRYIFSYTRIGYRLMRYMRPPERDGTGRSPESVDAAQIARVTQLLGLARAFEDQQRSQRSRLLPRDSGDRVVPLARGYADWPAFLEYIRVLLLLRQETVGVDDSTGNGSPSVRILTVHASKGLEFPVVYLPGLADRRFPMQRRGSSAPLLPGISEDEATTPDDSSTHLAEEACLFYVALTRAQEELVLSWAEFYGRMRYRISPFLAPIGTALGARLRREQWALALPLPAPARPSTLPAPARALQGPVRHSEIEMYQRCPRQYAYRYVYNLQPREIGLATLRYVLHATLSRLQRRLARLGRARAAGERPARVSLQDAQNLFQSEWEKKLEQERRIQQDGGAEEIPAQLEKSNHVPGDSFLEVYRRHGMQVVERAWREMMQRQPPLSEQPAPDSNGLVFDTQEMHFDEQVTVQVRGRELSVVLDRVERGVASDSPDGPGGRPSVTSDPERRASGRGSQGGTSVPLRLVRHRLGNNGVGKPDLHALFYALAAQQGGTQATELYSHNLTTGELDRVVLDERKIAKLHDELDAILEGIESGYFPPRPDPNLCASCPFLLICPA